MKLGIVRSRFNEEITQRLLEGAVRVLQEAKVNFEVLEVPGAIEIPLASLALLQSCEAVIACGAVIEGETDHYRLVCDSVNLGLTQLALSQRRPVVHAILACRTEEQAWERVGGSHGHKGEDAARVALEMLEKLKPFLQAHKT